MDLDVSPGMINEIANEYLILRPFNDAKEKILALQSSSRLGILSNGSRAMLEAAIGAAGLSEAFEWVISSEEVRCYKPDLRMYKSAASYSKTPESGETLYVSGNDWDAAGAKAFGFKVAWVNRTNLTFGGWGGLEPDHHLSSIGGLDDISKDNGATSRSYEE
jgi:2-haloacid dehalogenase